MNKQRHARTKGRSVTAGRGMAYESPANAYVLARVHLWLARFAATGGPLGNDFFHCLNWAAGDMQRLLLLLAEAARQRLPEQYEAINKEVREKIEGGLEDDGYDPDFGYHGPRPEPSVLKKYPLLEPFARETIIADQSAAPPVPRKGTVFASARRRLRAMFGLSPCAAELAECIFIIQTCRRAEVFFEDRCRIWHYENLHRLAFLLDAGEEELQCAFDELTASCLLDRDVPHNLRLHARVLSLWRKGTTFASQFCRPISGPAMPLENFHIKPEEAAHILALLRGTADKPVHILLYGRSGAGKTSFARSLAGACGGRAWAVASRTGDDDSQRRSSLMACLYLSSRHPGSLVLADEAERLLDTDMRPGFANKDKAWLNDLLERPGRRVIWITNQIDHLDPAVLRRFSFSLHFDSLGPRERLALWRQIATDLRVADRLPEQALQTLARDHDAPAAVVSEALRQAKTLYRKKADFLPAVERVLHSHATLRNRGLPPRVKTRAAPDFSREGISLEGAESSVADLLEACRRIDEALRSPAGLAPGAATMLFYGPPGTGKSALARHIALEFDRECLVKRASDLLDPYVGMTERRIAHAFSAAETQGAVLVVDEADSFLSSRSELGRQWERTMVNEFLTALEDCRGICICTTNSRERMDAAAMRRFAHKLAFGYAKPEQAAALYHALLAPLVGSPLPLEEEKDLFGLTRLTPGDFQVVRAQRQSLFAGSNKTTHGELIAALRREMDLKLEKNTRTIGFAMR